MDLEHPIRAVVSTLDGPVLEVLARTTRALTGREVHRLAATGSPNGIRLALSRLTGQGLVHAEWRATAVFYLGNREHLAWPAVEQLAGLRTAFLERVRSELRSWRPSPDHASIFGSAARADGNAESDIDVLLIRPDDIDEDAAPWADQVDRLRTRVRTWTGNHCQILQLDRRRLAEHVQANDPLVDAWRRESITMAGPEFRTILRQLHDGTDQ